MGSRQRGKKNKTGILGSESKNYKHHDYCLVYV